MGLHSTRRLRPRCTKATCRCGDLQPLPDCRCSACWPFAGLHLAAYTHHNGGQEYTRPGPQPRRPGPCPGRRRRHTVHCSEQEHNHTLQEPLSQTEQHASGSKHGPATAVGLWLIWVYQSGISPLIPKSCRFVPTCSEYSKQAVLKFGMPKAAVLTAWRVVRCNPWGGSGYDPPVWPPPSLRHPDS